MAASLLWRYFKLNLSSMMEYRASFFLRSTFMFLNDIVWMLFWWFFFAKFQGLGGWQFNDMIMLYAFITVSFGITMVLFGNAPEIAGLAVKGGLDVYLTMPKNALYHILISKMSQSAWGDFAFGVLLFAFFYPWSWMSAFIFVAGIVSGCCALLGFVLLSNSVVFWWGSSTEFSRRMWHGLVAFSSYPSGVFSGVSRSVLLFVIPAGLVTWLPVELLKSFSWQWLIIMLSASFAFLLAGIMVFFLGLKRYESGNLIGARV